MTIQTVATLDSSRWLIGYPTQLNWDQNAAPMTMYWVGHVPIPSSSSGQPSVLDVGGLIDSLYISYAIQRELRICSRIMHAACRKPLQNTLVSTVHSLAGTRLRALSNYVLLVRVRGMYCNQVPTYTEDLLASFVLVSSRS